AQRGERAVPIVDEAGRVVDGVHAAGDEGGGRVEIAGRDGRRERGRVRRRGVRSHAAVRGTHRRGGLGGGNGRRLDTPCPTPRALGGQRSALGFPQLARARLLGGGFIPAAGGAHRRGEGEAGFGVVEEPVGGGGDVDGGAGELDRGRVLA